MNEEAGESLNPAGSEFTPRTESQMAAPEADVIAKPPSPTPAATPSQEAQAEETHAESTADTNSDTADAATI